MKTKLLKAFVVLLFLTPVSCVQKYWPDLGGKYEKALVVEATFTNSPGPYTVRLSLSSSAESPKLNVYSGCEVSIICEDGTTEILTEDSPGTYLTSADGIRGETGKAYKIMIKTPDQQTFESPFEELKVPVELAAVYAEEETQHAEGLNHDLTGLRFYIDTKMASNNSYVMWKLESTHKYQSDFLTYQVYNNHQLTDFPTPDSFRSCWLTRQIPELFIYETSQLTKPQLTHFPLHFVSTEGRELSIRYSLLVRQLTISAEAYTFWNSIREQNENQGSLYTSQPYQIRGNVQNVSHPDNPAMGYFLVAGVSEKRIYINRPLLDYHYPICELTEDDYKAFGFISYKPQSSWPLYVTYDINWRAALPDQHCIDCRLKSGTINKPDFWED